MVLAAAIFGTLQIGVIFIVSGFFVGAWWEIRVPGILLRLVIPDISGMNISFPYAVRCIFLLASSSLLASAQAHQPLITDDTGTQGAGGHQLEFSVDRDRARQAGQTDRITALPVVYTYGLTDNLDLFFGLAYARIDTGNNGGTAHGFASPALGAKWRFYDDEESGFSMAVKPEVFLPVSSRREGEDFGTGKTSGRLSLVMTQEVPFGMVHMNLGAGRWLHRQQADEPNENSFSASVAPVWQVSEKWQLALDLGTVSQHPSGSGNRNVRTNFMELGTIYSLFENLQFAAGVIRARGNDKPRTSSTVFTTGLSWQF